MNLSQLLAQYLQNAVKNWKSTVQSFLSFLVAIGLYFITNPSPDANPHVVAVVTFYVGLAKFLLGMAQKD